MSRNLAESALMIGLMVLSIASNSHRHRSGNSPLHPPHPSILEEAVGPPGLANMVFVMSRSFAESALFIGSIVLSKDAISHRQFAPTASPTFDFQESIVGPPALAKTVSHMSKRRPESTLSIASTVLSNDSISHRHPQCQFAPTPSHPSNSEEASSDLRNLI
jgi:hypothetical protein